MKNQLYFLFVSVVLFSFPEIKFPQTLESLILIAHSLLFSTTNDTTGMNAPTDLLNIPSQDAGIYGNRIYNDCAQQNSSSELTPKNDNHCKITKFS